MTAAPSTSPYSEGRLDWRERGYGIKDHTNKKVNLYYLGSFECMCLTVLYGRRVPLTIRRAGRWPGPSPRASSAAARCGAHVAVAVVAVVVFVVVRVVSVVVVVVWLHCLGSSLARTVLGTLRTRRSWRL